MDRKTMLVIVLLGVLAILVIAYHDEAVPITQAAQTTVATQKTQKTQPEQHFTIASTHQSYSILGSPTITPAFINRVLTAYGSPAQGLGQTLYDLSEQYGIKAEAGLAFFQHESTFGKFGMAAITHSLGNLRCISDAACVDTTGQPCQPGESCYASFPTWSAGFEAWYKLIRTLYINTWHLTTIAQIIPRYAPSADNNDEAAYIASVEHSITMWQEGQVLV